MRILPFRRTRPATRRGFSFIELMVVFVVFGLVAAIGVPRFDYMRATTKMRSAETEITSILATARATAIRRGRPAYVERSGNVLRVVTVPLTGSVRDTIVRPVGFDVLYEVTIVDAPATVTYDSRGLAMLGGTPARYVFARETHRDTVCITGWGSVKNDGCP